MSRPITTTQSTAPSGSTTTTTQQQPATQIPFTITHGTLVLRAEPAEERHIQWAEDVVDNEGMGRKSSKVCCIYHKPRTVDESSDDSSDSSSSDSDSDSGDDGGARPIGGNRNRGRPHNHRHRHDGDDSGGGGTGKGKGKAKARKRSPNAYEKMPNYGKKKEQL